MLFLKSWLEDYIDLSKIDDSTLEQKITLKSSEVDDYTIITDYFDGKVVIGQITNLYKHPEADKLNIFEVNFGDKLAPVTIVSAAPNVTNGLVIPVALVGCKLPLFEISERKLRGVTSYGMCLGMSELALETGMSAGLWELNELLDSQNLSNVLGHSICKILPQYFPQDVVIDIKVLPNKIGAIGSHLGMALEIAGCLENRDLLTPLAASLLDPSADIKLQSSNNVQATFEDRTNNYTKQFNLYELNLGQQNYELPHKLLTRLFLLNQNLTCSIADLSNYLLLDVGQPSHFFDLDKLVS